MDEYIKQIIQIEWEMFTTTVNIGGRASCQDDYQTFYIMRKTQYQVWEEPVLESCYHDFLNAQENHENLVAYKYGYMMRWTFPDEYEKIRAYLPEISCEKQTLIETILDIQIRQTEEFRKEYPRLAERGRPLRQTGPDTSLAVYNYGELAALSVRTLKLFCNQLMRMDQNRILYPKQIMMLMTKAYNFSTLEEAEAYFSVEHLVSNQPVKFE